MRPPSGGSKPISRIAKKLLWETTELSCYWSILACLLSGLTVRTRLICPGGTKFHPKFLPTLHPVTDTSGQWHPFTNMSMFLLRKEQNMGYRPHQQPSCTTAGLLSLGQAHGTLLSASGRFQLLLLSGGWNYGKSSSRSAMTQSYVSFCPQKIHGFFIATQSYFSYPQKITVFRTTTVVTVEKPLLVKPSMQTPLGSWLKV